MSLISLSTAARLERGFQKIRLAAPTREALARFGGRAPKGIIPKRRDPLTSFLLTLPVDDRKSASFFLSVTSYDPDSALYVFSKAGVVQADDSPLLEVVIHESTLELSGESFGKEFPRLIFENADNGEDPPVDIHGAFPDPDDCFDHHKLGGFPYFYQANDIVTENSFLLLRDGFSHVFQLAFPGPDDAEVNCDWPFGELVFHVYFRKQQDREDIRCIWA